jgi:hypothetical protein
MALTASSQTAIVPIIPLLPFDLHRITPDWHTRSAFVLLTGRATRDTRTNRMGSRVEGMWP